MKGLDYDALFPGRFLKAGEFNGREVTLTIASIELEDLPQEAGGTRVRGIIGFERTKKKLVLNRTNGEAIRAMFGRDTGEWIGKRVTLYPAPFQGEVAIRVKGSPDLADTITFELKLPRKRPQSVKLHKTVVGEAKKPEAPPQTTPAPIVDTETGEVF